jgi:hypothetical protein
MPKCLLAAAATGVSYQKQLAASASAKKIGAGGVAAHLEGEEEEERGREGKSGRKKEEKATRISAWRPAISAVKRLA